MESSNAERQVEELLNLQEKWYSDAIQIKTPALFDRLKRVGKTKGILEVKKCLAFEISCNVLYPEELGDLILSFEFPLDYPTDSICNVKAMDAKSRTISSDDCSGGPVEFKSCTSQITNYLESFRGCECVELVLDWIDQNKETCLNDISSEKDMASNDDKKGKSQCFVLRFNHLLSGSEHKKEKAMLDVAKKSILQGGLLWGTPGVVVVVPPSTEDDAKEYGSQCRNIGKRPDGVEEFWIPQEGIDEVGLGGLKQRQRGGRLQELDTAKLRMACCGDENLLRRILGVD
jgi:hypothetical protein